MTFQIVRDPVLGEEVWLATTPNGLPLRILPRPKFRETAAVITFQYGSTDLDFEIGGKRITDPSGTAHYLEHKLFEDEELAVFQRFAARGASVNAQTGFSRTSYFFQATSQVRDNLTDLLRLVSKPHITQENVDKERGIIAQEVRMYEDSADYCTTFDLLGCLFPSHPVRFTVGGTVDSIAAITPETLLQSWSLFYRTGNAALAVAGPVEPQEIYDLACACALPSGAPPARLLSHDRGPIGAARRERKMVVARPKVLIGVKDHTSGSDWQARTERAVRTNVVLDSMFATSSPLREAMHQRGEVDDSIGAGFMGDRTFAVTTLGCESENPAAAELSLRRALAQHVEYTDEHIERLRRRHLGGFVRGCESVRSLAFAHSAEQLDGAPPFHTLAILRDLTLASVAARSAELLSEDRLAVAVTERA
jgi:predicted Zn-dependent peptidase